MTASCTSSAVYGEKPPIYRVYMARTPKGRSAAVRRGVGLPWRITRIRLWRKKADLTQQRVADQLSERFPELDYSRESIQRIETGNQRPPVIVLEALVSLLGAPNLTALLDRTPEEAMEIHKIEVLPAKERQRLLRLMEAVKDE